MLESVARAMAGFADALTIIAALVAALIFVPMALLGNNSAAVTAIAITVIPYAISGVLHRSIASERAKPDPYDISQYDDILRGQRQG